MKRLAVLLLTLAALTAATLLPVKADADVTVLRLGILEYRPHVATLRQWQPTIEQLERIHSGPVTVVVKSYDELNQAVARREIDLLLTNSSHTVQLQRRNALTQLANVSHIIGDYTVSVFGGVIVTQTDTDIHTLADLRDARIAAPTEHSLGGYQAQRFIIKQNNIDLSEEQFIFTGLPHDRSFNKLLSGEADVAFVRTGFLESWWAENPGKARELRVINPQMLARFPLAVSTRLYPEWSMVALDHVAEADRQMLARALQDMPPAQNQAMWPQTWGLPQSNLAIVELLQSLNLPPFTQPPTPGFQYRTIILPSAALLLLLLTVAAVWLTLRKRRAGSRQPALEQNQPATGALLASDPRIIFDQLPDPMLVLNAAPPHPIEYASPGVEDILGVPPQILLETPNWLQINSHLDDHDRLFEYFSFCHAAAHPHYRPPITVWLRHADGRWIAVWLSGRCEHNQDHPELWVTVRTANPAQAGRDQLCITSQKSRNVLLQIQIDTGEPPQLLAANERLEELTGIPLDQALGDLEQILTRIHPDDQAQLQQLINKQARPGRYFATTLRFYNADSRLRWLEVQATPEHPDERSTIWHAVARDHTRSYQRAQMLTTLNQLQRAVMQRPQLRNHFKQLLTTILRLTDCEHGFIGELYDTNTQNPWMKTWALTNMAWDEQSRKMFRQAEQTGFVIDNLDNLIGEPLKTGKTFVTNAPQEHPAYQELPPGHPPLKNFACIPIFREQQVIGLIGLANSAIKQQINDLKFLQEHTPAIGQILHSLNLLQRERSTRKALAEELERKRQLMHSLGEGVYGTNHDGSINFINQAGLKILGFDEQELLGQDGHTLFHHHHPDGSHYPHEDCPVFQTMQDGITRKRGDEHVITKDGQFVPVAMTSSVITNGSSNLGSVVVFRDISSFKAAQDHIRVLTTALDSAEAAIVITDTSGRILWSNRALEKLTGYSLAEVSGKNPGQLFQSGKQNEHFYRQLWSTIKQGDVWEGELVNKKKNGEYYDEHLTIAPVLNEKGEADKFVGIKRDITQQKQDQARMRYLAITDALTKLPNRRYFIERAEKEFARFIRKNTPSSVLMLDIDHFKKVNDTHGHAIGDEVLTKFAQTIRETLRETDLPGRLGGEEFAILATQETLPGAKLLAERIRKAVENMIVQSETITIRVTVSMGIAQFEDQDKNLESVIARADAALYRAKDGGRNRVEV